MPRAFNHYLKSLALLNIISKPHATVFKDVPVLSEANPYDHVNADD